MIERVVVISDTHGSFRALREIIERYQEEAYCYIHCGDGEREVALAKQRYPAIKLYGVAGNCDFGTDLPLMDQIVVGGKSILFTHGHRYGVKSDLEKLKQTARNVDADIVLYGHSHQSYAGYEDGLYILNPGSPTQPRAGSPSFGVVDIGEMGIVCNLVHFGGVWR